MPVRPTLLCTLALLTSASAQTHKPTPTPSTKPPTGLPVTRVSLYKNGVGFFEHSGRVLNDQSISIDFTSSQLNDVLQSLTAIDLQGGRITGAGYNSTTPIEQQLKSLPLALGEDATQADFFNAIRGARVSVTGSGPAITGRLLSIESRTTPTQPNQPPAEHQFLTVVSDAGSVRTLELTPAVSVTLLDTALHTDVTRYLELLASTRNAGLRHLTLEDRGTGPRDLRVSYISEVPVWKSTYRILITDAPSYSIKCGATEPGQQNHPCTQPPSPSGTPSQTATLQGWSVVDNTTGSDWLNVHLSLIAGAPQSFIQPLSTPYYTRRPEIPLPSEAQLSPQTHDSGDEDDSLHSPSKMPRENAGLAGMGSAAGGVIGGIASANQTVEVTADSAAPLPMQARAMKNELRGNYKAFAPPPVPPSEYEALSQQSLTPATTTSAFDDYFEYALTDPITIRKNESALVPILQTKLPVERVTLWSPQQPIALRALWITNTSTLTLDRGSFSIVENGSFGGEGLLDPIHPDERRLLSYAADQAVRVSQSAASNTRRVQHLTIKAGVLTETSTDVSDLTYDIKNAAPESRTVVIEHPTRPGWELTSDTKPTEITPTTQRFKVLVPQAHTSTLHITERHTNYDYIRLTDRTEDQLTLLLRNAKASPATIAALQPVFDAHHKVIALDQQISALTSETASITQDQTRLRENMKALKGSPEEKALLTRYTGELNAQEDRLAAINHQLTDLRTQRTQADADFQQKLESLTLDESL